MNRLSRAPGRSLFQCSQRRLRQIGRVLAQRLELIHVISAQGGGIRIIGATPRFDCSQRPIDDADIIISIHASAREATAVCHIIRSRLQLLYDSIMAWSCGKWEHDKVDIIICGANTLVLSCVPRVRAKILRRVIDEQLTWIFCHRWPSRQELCGQRKRNTNTLPRYHVPHLAPLCSNM